MSKALSDLRRSFLLGPARSLIPAVLNIVLVPIIVAKGGIHAVGLWGVINLVISIFMLCDLGMSQFVTRAISGNRISDDAIRMSVSTILSTWLLVTAVLIAVAVPLAPWLLREQALAVEPLAIAALALILVSGCLSLVSNLLIFMHVAAHHIHFSQVNDVVASAVQFAVAVAALQLLSPFVALALAVCARYVVQCIVLYGNLQKICPDVTPTRLTWPAPRAYFDLLVKSKGFAAIGISKQLIHIVNRTGMLMFGGTAALGLFEIARRVPFLLEQSFSNGLRALFAFFAGADWDSADGRAEIRGTVLWVYKILVVTSIGALAGWILEAGPVIGLWLNLQTPDLILATQLFALHNIVRTMNIPTFWLSQARGGENAMGTIFFGQVALLILSLVVLSTFVHLNFLEIAITITVLNILAEIAALSVAQRLFGYVTMIIQRSSDAIPFIAAIALIATAWWLAAPPVGRTGALASGLLHAALFLPVWLASLFALSGGRPRRLVQKLHRPASKSYIGAKQASQPANPEDGGNEN